MTYEERLQRKHDRLMVAAWRNYLNELLKYDDTKEAIDEVMVLSQELVETSPWL